MRPSIWDIGTNTYFYGHYFSALIIGTVLFNGYVRQKHFEVSKFLSSRECIRADCQNSSKLDLCFLKRAYQQKELRDIHIFPEGLSDNHARELGLTNNGDATAIEAGMIIKAKTVCTGFIPEPELESEFPEYE